MFACFKSANLLQKKEKETIKRPISSLPHTQGLVSSIHFLGHLTANSLPYSSVRPSSRQLDHSRKMKNSCAESSLSMLY